MLLPNSVGIQKSKSNAIFVRSLFVTLSEQVIELANGDEITTGANLRYEWKSNERGENVRFFLELSPSLFLVFFFFLTLSSC